MLLSLHTVSIRLLEKYSFSVISLFFFTSYWFFSFFVLQNGGSVFSHPLGIAHHVFPLSMYDRDFVNMFIYNFTQAPLYSVLTWLLLKSEQSWMYVYIILHHVVGYYAIFCLYRILQKLNINSCLITLGLSMFVFNPAYYHSFSTGWYDYLTMCLVSIVCYHFVALQQCFKIKRLVTFFIYLTILVSYRNMFHPILFAIPSIIFICLRHKEYCKRIIFYSIIPLMICVAPYIKNYFVFGTFSTSIGSLAIAQKTLSFEYITKEQMMKDIQDKTLSPIVLCYNGQVDNTFYNNMLYNKKTCAHDVPSALYSDKVNDLLTTKPYLHNASMLPGVFGESSIPNTLLGLVVAKDLIKNHRSFIRHHPSQYIVSVKNAIRQYFRTNNSYAHIIAVNGRHFPDWFASPKMNLDFLPMKNPVTSCHGVCDDYPRLLIIFGIILSLCFGLFYILCDTKRLWTYMMITLIGLSILALSKNLIDVAWIGFILMFIFAFSAMTLYAIKLMRNTVVIDVTTKAILCYMIFIILYFGLLIVTIVGSEQERYRFVTDGIQLVVFLFFINKLYLSCKRTLSEYRFKNV